MECIKRLDECICNDVAISPVAKQMEGLDMILLWEEQIHAESDDSEYDDERMRSNDRSVSPRTTHIVALELKDHQSNSVDECNKKRDSLPSLCYIIWWMKVLYRYKYRLVSHIT